MTRQGIETLAMFAVMALVPASLWAALVRLAGSSWITTAMVFIVAEAAVVVILCAVAVGKREEG